MSAYTVKPFSYNFCQQLFEKLTNAYAKEQTLLIGNYDLGNTTADALLISSKGICGFIFIETSERVLITTDGNCFSKERNVTRPNSGFSLLYESRKLQQAIKEWLLELGEENEKEIDIALCFSNALTIDNKCNTLPSYIHLLSTATLRLQHLCDGINLSENLYRKMHINEIIQSTQPTIYTPYNAKELFQKLFLLKSEPLSNAYKSLEHVFRCAIEQRLERSTLKFSGLFAKVDYLAKELKIDRTFYFLLNKARQHFYQVPKWSENQCKKYFYYDFETVCRFVSTLFDKEIPKQLSKLFPSSPLKDVTNTTSTDSFIHLRIILDHWDDKMLYGMDEHGISRSIHYGEHFPELRKLLSKDAHLNIIIPSKYRDADPLSAELIIYEPDYLVDISAIAACFESYAHSSVIHLLNKFRPFTHTRHTLLGNFAGQLLDEVIHGEYKSYSKSANTFFKQNALTLATLTDIDRNFHEEASKQRQHIEKALHTLKDDVSSFNRELLTLEPSFFSEMLGLQGRMDCLQLDSSILIEQKAGKGAFPPNKDAEVPRQQEKHYVQLLLYLALLHYNYNKPYDRIYSFLLYSHYSKALLHLGRAPKLLREAIAIRNEIVWCEYRYAEGGGDVLRRLTADNINNFHIHNSLWERYQKPQLESLLFPIQHANLLEQHYFYRFFTFIAAEHIAAKVGNNTKENSGFAARWHDSLNEKRKAGNIFENLSLSLPTSDQAIEKLTLHFAENTDCDTVDFRVGDIVILYAYSENSIPDLRRNILFRGTLIDMSSEHIIIKLNAPQTNSKIFKLYNSNCWAVEHDFYESSFRSLYANLYAFLNTTKERKDLLLLQREPHCHPTTPLKGDYGKFNTFIQREESADELFILIGPPGTGKTSFGMLNILKENLAYKERNILLTSYTNRAVDEICSKLVEENIDFLRIGSEHSCEVSYHKYLLSNKCEACKNVDEVRQMIENTRVFCGTTTSLTSSIHLFTIKKFDLAIVDEASQILEPQLLGLLSAKHKDKDENAISKFVLIGDHKQLPAVVQQSAAESLVTDPALLEIGLTNCRLSLFERLLKRYIDNPSVTYRFTLQGRMHNEINRFASNYFYENKLDVVPLKHQHQPLPHFIDETDCYTRLLLHHRFTFIDCPTSENYISEKSNEAEAYIIAKIAAAAYKIIGEKFDPLSSIGIIVPYRGQIATIRCALRNTGLPKLADISIDTVERYQGSQRDIIIYGFTVRHPHQLSFLCGQCFEENGYIIDRKLNVALTRARLHMIMVGNAKVLSGNPVFRQLINYCRKIHSFSYADSYRAKFRKAQHSDLEQIMHIIDDAKTYMAEQGNNQWTTDYPSILHIKADINSQNGFVLSLNNKIVAYGAILKNGEPTYNHLSEGQWHSQGDYLVVHRLSVSAEHRNKQFAYRFLTEVHRLGCKENVKSIRIDTHDNNNDMIALLLSLNYKVCGKLIYKGQGERTTYDYILHT